MSQYYVGIIESVCEGLCNGIWSGTSLCSIVSGVVLACFQSGLFLVFNSI